jgi:hypothetical protein
MRSCRRAGSWSGCYDRARGFASKALVLSAVADDSALKIASRRIGPALVFERLWEETGCRAVIEQLNHRFR